MRALYVPGPSYQEESVREVAGWTKILDLYFDALVSMGYSVEVPEVDHGILNDVPEVRVSLYSQMAAAWVRDRVATFGPYDLLLGAPAYSLGCMEVVKMQGTFCVVYVWNNADWYRDQQLIPESEKMGTHYSISPAMRWMNNRALAIADHVHACSPFVKGTYSEVVDPAKISFAFWGVDHDVFTPPVEPEPGFRVLFIGSDFVRKGLRYLIEAMNVAFKDVPADPVPELVLAGFGDHIAVGEKLPYFVEQLGTIYSSTVPLLMRQCHVIVIPTLEDGIALSIQEGMASGLVPITTPETSEAFEDGVSGITVPYRAVQEIADALRGLYDDRARLAEMSAQAVALATQQTWEQFAEEFKMCIAHALEGDHLFEGDLWWKEGGSRE